MLFSHAQPFIYDSLGALPAFTGVPRMQQLGEHATADAIAEAERTFEGHMLTAGLCVIVARPEILEIKPSPSAALLSVGVELLLFENPEVQRSAGGLATSVDQLVEQAIAGLVSETCTFPRPEVVRVDVEGGYLLTVIQPALRCVVRRSAQALTRPAFEPGDTSAPLSA